MNKTIRVGTLGTDAAPDPIFTAVARVRAVSEACENAPGDVPVRLSDKLVRAEAALMRTVPSSLGGLIAMIAFLEEWTRGDTSWTGPHLNGLLANLSACIRGLAGASGAVTRVSPDIELLNIGPELDAAIVAAEAAWRRLRDAEDRSEKIADKVRRPLRCTPTRRSLLAPYVPPLDSNEYFLDNDGCFGYPLVEVLRRRCVYGLPLRVKNEMRRIIAAWDEYTAALARARADLECERLDGECEAALDRVEDLWKRVGPLRAHTLEGLRVKARLALFYRNRGSRSPDDGFVDGEHEVGCCLIDDLLAVEAGASAA